MKTAKQFFNEKLSGEPLTEEAVIEGLVMFAKLHVKSVLKKVVTKEEIKLIKYEIK